MKIFNTKRYSSLALRTVLLASTITIAQAGVLTFEDGIDNLQISVSEPGVQFTTTAGFDWIYGDWRTGSYNGPYPDGSYTSNGNIFAWLGPNQGLGRIDFDLGVAKSVSTRYSSFSTVKLEAFDSDGILLDIDEGGGNLDSGSLNTLAVEAPNIAYVFVHDSGNYWLIDDFEFELNDVELLEVDLQIDSNQSSHRTDDYDEVVLRRSAKIDINVVLSTGYDDGYYELSMALTNSQGEEFVTVPGTESVAGAWRATIGEAQMQSTIPFFEFDDYLVVPTTIYVPTDLPLDRYQISARLQRNSGVGTPEMLAADDKVYFVFNPWSPKDSDVYGSLSSVQLNEYVLEDSGTLYSDKGGFNWHYDQFDQDVLETTFSLLNSMDYAERGSAEKISRHLSALSNVQNDNGVLVGRWDGKYGDGKTPGSWSSSSSILSQYSNSGSVKYGQCWVFAGLVSSMGRTLGIPTRAVTNIGSAHDTQPYDGFINLYSNRADIPKSLIDSGQVPYPESIWNFHVWNEMHLNYQGSQWQAVDGTPQEVSGGIYRMGPAPITNVKANSGGNYDVTFVHNEVQAKIKVYYFNTTTQKAILLSEKPYRSEHIFTDTESGKADRLNNYCEDCSSDTSFLDILYEHTEQFVDFMFTPGIHLLIPSAHAQETPAVADGHTIELDFPEQFSPGGSATGSLRIVNLLGSNDVVTAIVSLRLKSQDGTAYHSYYQNQFNDLQVDAGGSYSIPLNIDLSIQDKMVLGADFFELEVVVLGLQGNGYGSLRKSLSGPVPQLSFIALDSNGSTELVAHLQNELNVDLLNVSLLFSSEEDITLYSSLEQQIGNLPSNSTVSVSWVFDAPIDARYITISVDYGNGLGTNNLIKTEPRSAGKASLAFGSLTPMFVGNGEQLSLSVTNSGGTDLQNIKVAINADDDLGEYVHTESIDSIPSGNSYQILVPVQAIRAGSFPVTAHVLDTDHYASTNVVVRGEIIISEISLSPSEVPASFSGNIDVFIDTDSLETKSVKINSIAGNPNTIYAIYDGVQRILSSPVEVPPQGKKLTLRIDESGNGGWIRFSALPLEDPVGTSSTILELVGGSYQTNVDGRVSKTVLGLRYDRRAKLFNQAIQITNSSDSSLNGPVQLVISDINPGNTKIDNQTGALADGRPYIELTPEGVGWAPGETINVNVRLSPQSNQRVSFDTQILATVTAQ